MKKVIFFLILTIIAHNKNPQLTEHTLPIYGNASLGYYFVKIFIGTPPQQQSVIIDTASGQLAIPCNKCTNCNPKHINEPFNMQKSKTAEYVTCESSDPHCYRCNSKSPTQECRFMISYAEGSSLQGFIVKDYIQFQSFSEGEGILGSFGCTVRESNLFLKQEANGIFGLAPKRSSPLLEDLYKKHHGYSGEDLSFSLCIGGNGGLMTIGKINPSLHIKNQSIKTTYSEHRSLFTLDNVGEIRAGQSIIHKKKDHFGMFGIFIDSGSTFTYFPRQNFLIFKKELQNNCARRKQVCEVALGQSVPCFHIKGDQDIDSIANQIFSPIQIDINGKTIEWKAQNYFLLRDVKNRQICLGIEGLDRFLLGSNWMVDRDVIFNMKQKTVEIFPESNCSNVDKQVTKMNPFSQEIEGHKPLNYQSAVEHLALSLKGYNILIVLGIILVMIGVVGVFCLILRQRQRNNRLLHNPVSSIQTDDHIQLAVSKQTQTPSNIE